MLTKKIPQKPKGKAPTALTAKALERMVADFREDLQDLHRAYRGTVAQYRHFQRKRSNPGDGHHESMISAYEFREEAVAEVLASFERAGLADVGAEP